MIPPPWPASYKKTMDPPWDGSGTKWTVSSHNHDLFEVEHVIEELGSKSTTLVDNEKHVLS
jgi:hypothetical protein